MRKSTLSKRFLSIATAFMLIVSASNSLVSVSAATDSDVSVAQTVYDLLDTENYSDGWNTDGIVQNNLMTDVVSGKTLNRVSANYDPSGEVRLYIDCKSPSDAGFNLADIHSLAFYFKNGADKEIQVNFQNYTDKNTSSGWVTAFGRIMNCAVYLVSTNSDTVKPTFSDSNGLVTIPEGFEGYVVYEVDTRTTSSSNSMIYDLLSSEYTLGSEMSFCLPDGILKGGDVFYYGDIKAGTGTAKDFITTVKSSAVYRYPIATGIVESRSDLTALSYDTSDPYNTIFTFEMGSESNSDGYQQIYFSSKNISTYGTASSDITACSFYVKNNGGHGAVKLNLGNKSNGKYFSQTYWDFYDINTGVLTTRYFDVLEIPEGFEGYVILNVKQTDGGNPNSVYADIFGGGVLWFYQNQAPTATGLKMSIGTVTAWCCDYENVKQTLVASANKLGVAKSFSENVTDEDGNVKLKYTAGLNNAFDGKVTRIDNISNTGDIQLWYNLGSTLLGSYATSGNYPESCQAFAIYIKNPTENELVLNGMYQDNPWTILKFKYRLFDTAKQTITAASSPTYDIKVPAGFEGYAIMIPDSTYGDVSWQEYINNNPFHNVYFVLNTTDLGLNNTLFIGALTYVRSVDEFINKNLEVTLDGDANKDSTTDILDLVRVKKYSAGAVDATVCVPNVSYGENNNPANATVTANLKKQLLGGSYEAVAISQEVKDRFVSVTEEETEEDTVTPANAQVGLAVYHMSAGDWDKVYGSEKAESEFINYYAGNDISDVRTAKERGSAAWIYISYRYMNNVDGYQNMRDSLAKYVDTLKAEKLWNTVAGFEFEEITGATDTSVGNLEEFKELSEYLYNTYPEKRQFAVLSVYEVNQANKVANAYQHVTDIGFDWYSPNTADQLRTVLQTMKTNTGLLNAKYWFLPGVFTSTISAETATHAINQINACYQLLMEQDECNRGGLYFYNWKTFYYDGGAAYGIDELFGKSEFSAVKTRVFEICAALKNMSNTIKFGLTEISNGEEDGTTYEYNFRWMTFNSTWSDMTEAQKKSVTTFSYYVENKSTDGYPLFAWINGDWENLLVGTAYTYDINTGAISEYNITDIYGKSLSGGFKGYVLYDLTKCTVNGGSAAEFIAGTSKFNLLTYENNGVKNDSIVVNNVCVSTESFATVDAYYRALLP